MTVGQMAFRLYIVEFVCMYILYPTIELLVTHLAIQSTVTHTTRYLPDLIVEIF